MLCVGPFWALEINGLMTCKKGVSVKIFFRGLHTLVFEYKGLIEAVFNVKKGYKCNGNLRYALICSNKGIGGVK